MKESLLIHQLKEILKIAPDSEKITLDKVFEKLTGKGLFVFLIVFSLPFCLPIQIPGLSTLFGVVLLLMSLRLVFRSKVFWPKWIAKKKIKRALLVKIVKKLIKLAHFFEKLIHNRLEFLTKPIYIQKVHGITLCFCSLFLSLPLPIPLTNILAAFPILFLSIGLLEDDGVFVIVSYLLLAGAIFSGYYLFK